MVNLSGLSVAVSANVADFNVGVERAQQKAQSLSLSLFRMGRAADEAEGELDSTGRSALTTAGSFSALTAGTHGLNLSFGTLTSSLTSTTALLGGVTIAATALLSTLVPLAATLGTMVAAATGLAGAFGAIIGSGLIAFGKERGEQNQERLDQINARIESLEELEDTQEGLTEAQERELESLEEQADKLEEQTGIMGGLKSAMADLRAELQPLIVEFGQQFTPLIESAIGAFPALVRNILDAMGGMDRFAQALRGAGQTAFRVLPQMIASLMDLARQALPMVVDFGRWLIANGPRIFQGMVNTAKEVGPALLEISQRVIALIPAINRLGTWVINHIIPAFNKLTTFASQFAPQVNKIASEVQKSLPFFIQMGKNIADIIVPAGKDFLAIIGQLIAGFNSLAPGKKKLLISGLAAAFGILGGPIAAVGGAIVIAANHFDFFKGILNGLIGVLETVHGWLVGIWETIKPIIDALGTIAGVTGNALGSLNQPQTAMGPRGMGSGGRMGGQNTQVNVNIEGELPEDSIRDVSTEVVEDQARGAARNTATNTAPR